LSLGNEHHRNDRIGKAIAQLGNAAGQISERRWACKLIQERWHRTDDCGPIGKPHARQRPERNNGK